jgi:imidazolonepropionase-like amidohydrolase
MNRMANLTLRHALLVLFVCAFAPAATAQQVNSITYQLGVLSPQGLFAIKNARIVTVSGPDIENGTLVIRSGKIEAVGAGVAVPAGAQEIDARGLSVYPGMIDAGTAMGLSEIGQGAPGTNDLAETGDMNPNAMAIVAVNPYSANIAVTRVNGITSVVTMPQGGIISGQAALINLAGTTPKEMAAIPTAGLVINFPRLVTSTFDSFFNRQPLNINDAATRRDKQLDQLRKMLRDALAYGRAQDAYAADRKLPRPDRNTVLEALVPYARGERPVIMRADREIDIRNAVKFAEEMKLKPIIMGGSDAAKAASLLKQKDVPVIFTGVLNLPASDDDYYDVLYETPAKLREAGVRFCISTDNTGAEVRDLPYYAGMASAFGLSREEALKAVTLYPAQIFGVADRMGSIEPGKVANIVITDGDLLDARTHTRFLFIEGRQLPLTNRHTELYDAFKDRK